ncbi:DUF5819 family protein [Microbacterium sp. NPDC089695]|uniref:DUF5819 family protein n=1 Tax=Microbacterium sp. NPDC089695 TaxID=3364198 RepID=UPI00382DFA4D
MSRASRRSIGRRSVIVRVSTLTAVVFTAWHIFASFLWIAPPSPLRDAIPENALRSYMLPWYGQSWSVFAPAPINGDYQLKVRATVTTENGEEATEWVSATDVETQMHTRNLFPPRAGSLSIKQASNFKGAWDKLTAEQKEIAGLGFYKGDDWLGRMQLAMNEVSDNSNEAAVAAYVTQERYTDAYATQVARSIWGADVLQVQYEISRQGIIPFIERDNPDAQRPAPVVAITGWRGLITLDEQSHTAFAEVFRSAYEGMAK